MDNGETMDSRAASNETTNEVTTDEEIIGGGLPLRLVQEAVDGGISAMSAILRQFDGYIRRLARLSLYGTSYLNEDLYEDLKTRLIIETLRFKPRRVGGTGGGKVKDMGGGTNIGAVVGTGGLTDGVADGVTTNIGTANGAVSVAMAAALGGAVA